ncbi:MAG: tRNA epoxyqueuosine(34) reductase QueG [Alphaproteobacteria bacterium]|nr:tRNA epoxyqueuosine(34) reductase QueG [Alphaproteobacteria bacterium]
MTRGQEAKSKLIEAVRERATSLGFDAFGITSPGSIGKAGARLQDFLERGRHGDMDWLKDTAERRADPRQLMASARSVIVLGMSYGPKQDPLKALEATSNAAISVYAKGRDYHEVMKGRLKEIAGLVAGRAGCDVKVFVDTAPLMEKPLAAAAGLGWQGKHTNLVSREHGSWLFLGAILTEADLAASAPETDHCGSCRRCLDICPTDAFPAPYQLDARRCIAYLTVEYHGHIAAEFRKPIGNRVFGCDDCLAVCPWNKFAEAASEAKLAARAETDNPPLADLLALDDGQFRKRFAGTPVKRAGRARFLRNCLIAAGNSGDMGLAGSVEELLGDPSPLVRAMAVWAYGELLGDNEFSRARARYLPLESDADVIMEWNAGRSA